MSAASSLPVNSIYTLIVGYMHDISNSDVNIYVITSILSKICFNYFFDNNVIPYNGNNKIDHTFHMLIIGNNYRLNRSIMHRLQYNVYKEDPFAIQPVFRKYKIYNDIIKLIIWNDLNVSHPNWDNNKRKISRPELCLFIMDLNNSNCLTHTKSLYNIIHKHAPHKSKMLVGITEYGVNINSRVLYNDIKMYANDVNMEYYECNIKSILKTGSKFDKIFQRCVQIIYGKYVTEKISIHSTQKQKTRKDSCVVL